MNNKNDLINSIFKVSNSENISTLIKMSEGKNSLLYLLYVSEEELTPSCISLKLNISRARVTAMLNSLSRENLIDFSKDNLDKRKMHIKLTELGVQTVRNNIATMEKVLLALGNVIGEETLEQIFKVFEKISDNKSNDMLCD